MTFAYRTARAWADDHSAALDVRLGRLETIAFQRHPEIFRHFGTDGALYARTVAARGRRSPVARAAGAVLMTLAVIGALAPIGAVVALGADRFEFFRMDASRSVPFAGILFLLTIAMQVVLAVLWLRGGRRFDGLLVGITAVAAVFSGFGLVAFPGIAEFPRSEGWEAWYPATIAAFAVSLLFLLAQLARRRHRVPETVADAPAAEPADTGALIAALPADERDAIRADRDAALDILHERGLIDTELHGRARGQALGTLHTLDTAREGSA